jgi:hypothetical protein
MSTPSGDSVRAEIIENALVTGNPVKDSSKIPLTSSKPLYADSSSNLATDAPFPLIVTSSQATTTALLTVTGASTLSATGPLTNTIVAAAAVTTFTAAGYARVLITDSAGNVTTSNYYVQFGTLA